MALAILALFFVLNVLVETKIRTNSTTNNIKMGPGAHVSTWKTPTG